MADVRPQTDEDENEQGPETDTNTNAPSAGEERHHDADPGVTDHLEDVDVGAGCTEIWEHLAEHRDE